MSCSNFVGMGVASSFGVGMIDLGNYEALNGRGKEYNEKLKDQREKRKQ